MRLRNGTKTSHLDADDDVKMKSLAFPVRNGKRNAARILVGKRHSPSADSQRLTEEERRMYSFQSPYPQKFSLPRPIIRYILKCLLNNPTSGYACIWEKLIHTCKYFFSKHAILPVSNMGCGNDRIIVYRKYEYNKRIDITDDDVIKYWVYEKFYIQKKLPTNGYSFMIPKLYRCDVERLDLSHQSLTFEEYQLLTSDNVIEKLKLENVTITDSDGSMVTADRLFENLKNVRHFQMYFCDNQGMFLPETTKKLVDNLFKVINLCELSLHDLPDIFDVRVLTGILKNSRKIDLSFYFKADSDESKEILGNFIKEIIEDPPFNIPFLHYNGEDENDAKRIMWLYCQNY